jgi:hypothetical protein
MGFLDRFFFKKKTIETVSSKDDSLLSEAIDAFKNRGTYANLSDKQVLARSGEGYEHINPRYYGSVTLSTFNTFYRDHISKIVANERARLKEYREIARMPEIADVLKMQ